MCKEITIGLIPTHDNKEIPIRYNVRVGEVKLSRWRDGFENLFHLIRKRIKR